MSEPVQIQTQPVQTQTKKVVKEVVKEVVREVIGRSEDERGEKYVVRTLIVDPTTYIYDVVAELLMKYCDIAGKCPEDVSVPDAVVAVSTSNCKEWHDELFETISILVVVNRAPYMVYYVYDGGIEDLCIDETCWHHLDIPRPLKDLIDEVYGDLRAPCRK